MFLKKINNFSLKNYKSSYEFVLGLLASVLVFREPATIGILVFVIINVFFYRKINLSCVKITPIVIIAVPFLLNLFFIWNNDSLIEGIKHGEKYLSMVVFPVFIIGQRFAISIIRVLNIYTLFFTTILVIGFLAHVFFNIEQFQKYLNGELVWQMGYRFATDLESHAPALNMHVAFLVVANYYLLLSDIFKTTAIRVYSYRFLLFFLSLSILFIINTRFAVLNALLGVLIVSVSQVYKKISKKKLIIVISGTIVVLTVFVFSFVKTFPYLIDKYTNVTFNHLDKVGKLDDFENPEAEVYNSLVTRVSIWKTTWEKAQENLFFGVGAADSKEVLAQAYKDTNQKFLAKYKFPVHNQYLDFLLKFGLFGLFGALIYIIYIIWIANKNKSILMLFFFLLFFTSNLTDDFLIRFDGITFSAIWLSIYANAYYNNRLHKGYTNH